MNDATSSKARARVASAAESGVVEFMLGDVVSLRRAHPCGGRDWLPDRLGARGGLGLRNPGGRGPLGRRTLERRLIGFASRGNLEMSRAVAPVPRDADRGRGGVER